MPFYTFKNKADVQIGDVVAQRSSVDPENCGYNGFMNSIVEDIDEEHGLAMLCRPHVRVQKIGCTKGSAMVMCERYPVELNVMVDQFVCFARGTRGEKDNRLTT